MTDQLKLPPPQYCEWTEGGFRHRIVFASCRQHGQLDYRVLLVEQYFPSVDGVWQYHGSRTQYELLCIGLRAWDREVARLSDAIHQEMNGNGFSDGGLDHEPDEFVLRELRSDFARSERQHALWKAALEAVERNER